MTLSPEDFAVQLSAQGYQRALFDHGIVQSDGLAVFPARFNQSVVFFSAGVSC